MVTLSSILSTIATTATSILIGALFNYVRQKTKIMVTEATQKKLEDAAIDAIHFVEEHAKNIDKQSKNIQFKGAHKLDMAVKELLKTNKNMMEEQAENLIKSNLSKIVGLGATSIKPLT